MPGWSSFRRFELDAVLSVEVGGDIIADVEDVLPAASVRSQCQPG